MQPPLPGSRNEPPSAALAQQAVAAAGLGVWAWDVRRREFTWDDRIAQLHGFRRGDFDGTLPSFLSRVHPDDRPSVDGAIEAALERSGEFATEYRISRLDGSTAWIQARGCVVSDEAGEPLRLVGVAGDTTQLHDVRSQAGRSLDHITDGVILLDRQWRILYMNHRAGVLAQRAPDELIGTDFWEAIGEEEREGFRDVLQPAMDDESEQTFELHYGPLGGWFEVRVIGAPDGLSILFRNIDDRRAAEAAREELVAELERSLTRQRHLQGFTVELASAVTFEDIGRVILDRAREALGALFAGVALLDPDGATLRFIVVETVPEPLQDAWVVVSLDTPSALADAVRNSGALFHESREELLDDYPNLVDAVEAIGGAAFVNVALMLGDAPIGVLSMAWDAPRRFDAEDRAFIGALSSQCAQAVERARLFGRQRSVADTFQNAALPRSLPTGPHVTIDACYLPATRGLVIGGDWYDALALPDGRILLAVGDVSGHGVEAAAVMGQVRNAVRSYLVAGHRPAETLGLLDELLGIAGEELFATLVVGWFDPATSELVWANAGHPPLVLHTSEGARALGGASGPPAGAGVSSGYREVTTHVRRGDILVGCTDGLIERRHEVLDEGIHRLVQAVGRLAPAGMAEGWSARLAQDVLGDADRHDDVCVLALQAL